MSIDETALLQLRAHAVAAYPEECCGLLIGRRDAQRHDVIRVCPSANVYSGDRTHRYELDSQLLLAALVTARRAAEQVIGFYHSHPDGRSAPSTLDRALAWPAHSYLIIALSEGHAPALQSWRPAPTDPAAGLPFQPERVVIRK